MSWVNEVKIRSRQVESFSEILGDERMEEIRNLGADLKRRLAGRIIWNVNSTAAGGGVAEMLHTILSYARGLGVDTRWLVIGGNSDFFRITKRIHNALHGESGDGSALDDNARRIYEQVTGNNWQELKEHVGTGDIVILHDPQTAGLVPWLTQRGISVIWRCHIGNDVKSTQGDLAWNFLAPYLKRSEAFIFSRFAYLPDVLYHGRCLVVSPTIDPFSPKNQDMDPVTARSILAHLGVLAGNSGNGSRSFILGDGNTATVERRAEVIREGEPPGPDASLVVQVSRWDRLKDPVGVVRGFVRSISQGGADHAELVLAGPSVKAVADDPEGAEVFQDVLDFWKSLSSEDRARIQLVNLPMDDLQENAAMVNALQRHAAIVIQKSLREGFGLTVTEAMWKGRPVVASAVGGIQDQIEHGVSGLLLRDPEDAGALAGAITQILGNTGFARRLGRNARRRVAQNYLGLNLLEEYDDLLERIDSGRQAHR